MASKNYKQQAIFLLLSNDIYIKLEALAPILVNYFVSF